MHLFNCASWIYSSMTSSAPQSPPISGVASRSCNSFSFATRNLLAIPRPRPITTLRSKPYKHVWAGAERYFFLELHVSGALLVHLFNGAFVVHSSILTHGTNHQIPDCRPRGCQSAEPRAYPRAFRSSAPVRGIQGRCC